MTNSGYSLSGSITGSGDPAAVAQAIVQAIEAADPTASGSFTLSEQVGYEVTAAPAPEAEQPAGDGTPPAADEAPAS